VQYHEAEWGCRQRRAISIYPNPVNDYLIVKILEEGNGETGIELYDSRGRQIQSHIDRYPGNLRLEMGTLKAGIYMVKSAWMVNICLPEQ